MQYQLGGRPANHKIPVWLWALPVFTCGLAALVAPLAVAGKLKDKRVWTWAIGLTVLWLLGFALTGTGAEDSTSAVNSFGVTLYLVAWVGCIVFALVLGPRADWGVPATAGAPPAHFNASYDPNAAAVAAAQVDRKQREDARSLAAQDPGLARELRIGRPDLPRQFDDGGLVDLNSAPAVALVRGLGMTPEQAEQVIAVRDHLGSFRSANDLVEMVGFDQATADRMTERIILL